VDAARRGILFATTCWRARGNGRACRARRAAGLGRGGAGGHRERPSM